MKKLTALILLISFFTVTAQKKSTAAFSGTITNKTGDRIKIFNVHDQLLSEVKVLPDGKFNQTLEIKEGYYQIWYDKLQTGIYLKAQSNLKIAFDTKRFNESLQFEGEGKPENEYLKEKLKVTAETVGNPKEFYTLDVEAFKTRSELIKQKLLELLNTRYTVDKKFKQSEERNLSYEDLNRLIVYNSANTEAIDLKQYFDKIDTNSLSDSDFDFSRFYKTLLQHHFGRLSEETAAKQHIDADIAYLNAVSKIKQSAIKNQFLFDAAKKRISYVDKLEEYYRIYLSASSDQQNNKAITELYSKLITVSRGKMSPDFAGYLNYSGGNSSLSDFKGKYVYIDIWATWCKPCREELPFLKKIEHDYKDSNIEFVSISVDRISDMEKWKKFIEEKELGGIQLLADNASNSKFILDYYISGIPRFILLGPKGEIVSSNAPRPSSEELVALFKSLQI